MTVSQEEIDNTKAKWMTTLATLSNYVDAEELELIAMNADVMAMVAACKMYLDLREVLHKDSWLYLYLTKAADIYNKKSQELLEEIRIAIGKVDNEVK